MKNLQTAAAILAAYFILFRTGAGIFGPIKSKSRFLPVYIDGKVNPAQEPLPCIWQRKVNTRSADIQIEV